MGRIPHGNSTLFYIFLFMNYEYIIPKMYLFTGQTFQHQGLLLLSILVKCFLSFLFECHFICLFRHMLFVLSSCCCCFVVSVFVLFVSVKMFFLLSHRVCFASYLLLSRFFWRWFVYIFQLVSIHSARC